MFKNYIENANFEDTGFSYTLSLIRGKYKMVILYCLMEFNIVRYNELKRYIKTISHKTLAVSLKELEKEGVKVQEVSDEEKDEWEKASESFYKNAEKKYGWTPNLIETVKSIIKE